uniref:Putative secreted protein n=1 Tax=Amblyomma americanum TaxID=6943 RepID=A0A0C9S3V0_AMBAM
MGKAVKMIRSLCFAVLFVTLSCVWLPALSTGEKQKCGPITPQSFGEPSTLDKFCKAIDPQQKTMPNKSSWKYITVFCPRNVFCCARKDPSGNITYFKKETTKSTFCLRQKSQH